MLDSLAQFELRCVGIFFAAGDDFYKLSLLRLYSYIYIYVSAVCVCVCRCKVDGSVSLMKGLINRLLYGAVDGNKVCVNIYAAFCGYI